jgi:hypothetical protein
MTEFVHGKKDLLEGREFVKPYVVDVHILHLLDNLYSL